MKNIKLYERVKNLFNSILKKDKSSKEIIEERVIDSTHGFQLIKDDTSSYFKKFFITSTIAGKNK